MRKQNRLYHVTLERVINTDTPNSELPPVVGIQIHVIAENINQAMQRAWDVLRTIPEEYEIRNVNTDDLDNYTGNPRYR